MSNAIQKASSPFKRIAAAVLGCLVLVLGVIMIVTPGPAIILIPAGLAILATQFEWARRLLRRILAKINEHRARQGKPPVKIPHRIWRFDRTRS